METYLDRLKKIFEVERLGNVRREHLQQDFHSVVFLTTLESVLCRRATLELAATSRQNGSLHIRQANRAVSYSAILARTIVLLADGKKGVEATLEELHHLFKTNSIPQRPVRNFSRKRVLT